MQASNDYPIRVLLLAAGLVAGLTAATSVLAAAGVPAPAAATAAGSAATPDGNITAQVKDALSTAGYRDVNVSTNNGVVTLMGSASSPEVKASVTQVAKSVEGVKDVDNSRLRTPAERQQQGEPPPSQPPPR